MASLARTGHESSGPTDACSSSCPHPAARRASRRLHAHSARGGTDASSAFSSPPSEPHRSRSPAPARRMRPIAWRRDLRRRRRRRARRGGRARRGRRAGRRATRSPRRAASRVRRASTTSIHAACVEPARSSSCRRSSRVEIQLGLLVLLGVASEASLWKVEAGSIESIVVPRRRRRREPSSRARPRRRRSAARGLAPRQDRSSRSALVRRFSRPCAAIVAARSDPVASARTPTSP